MSATPAKVDNFMLVDAQNMEAHELYRMADDKAIVLVSTGVGCPIARAMTPALKALRDKYAAQGVEMFLVDSNLQDGRDAILKEAKDFDIDIPILMDSNQLVGEALGVTRTAEVFVVTPKTWKVAYHGPVNDASDYGIQKAADKPFADIAISAVLKGEPAPPASQASKGCLVDFPAREKKAQLTYVKDVAPILEAKCVACHEEGGIGPFAMNNYAMVKGFAPMIREVIRTDRMPLGYNADPHIGKFSDDKNLSPAEIKTLVHWVEEGAPRGDGTDPLGAVKHVAPDWPLGKPDLVLNVPAYTIPASGVVDYQHPWVKNPETEGKWLKASTVKVESRQGVHHVLTGYMKDVPQPGQQAFENAWGVSVGGYAVGAESEIAPKDVGTYIPPGGAIGFQTHYTPFGKEVTDHTQIALYFYKDNQKPDLVMHNFGSSPTRISSSRRTTAPCGNRLYGVPEGRPALFGLPARPLSRRLVGPVDPLPGRQGKGAAFPAALRFQLAAGLHLRRAGEGAGGLDADRPLHLRQLQAQPEQPRLEQDRGLGRPDPGRRCSAWRSATAGPMRPPSHMVSYDDEP